MLKLAEKESVPFSFYVNPGRAVDFKEILRNITNKNNKKSLKLCNFQKLGYRYWLETIFSNPEIGKGNESILKSLLKQGHELGLHGGMNHGTWQRSSQVENIISTLLIPAMEWFENNFGIPAGFTSPGFRKIEKAYSLLNKWGLRYISDTINSNYKSEPKLIQENGIIDIPCIATKNGIPLLEHDFALGEDLNVSIKKFINDTSNRKWIVLYGHPSFEGIIAQKYLVKLIREIKLSGYRFCTVDEIIKNQGQ
ncbi:MAG: hypothetical protein ACQESQ_09590 [Bacteroidota bacterium]